MTMTMTNSITFFLHSLNNIDSILELEILASDWLTQKKIVIVIVDGPWAIPVYFLTRSPALVTQNKDDRQTRIHFFLFNFSLGTLPAAVNATYPINSFSFFVLLQLFFLHYSRDFLEFCKVTTLYRFSLTRLKTANVITEFAKLCTENQFFTH